MRLAGFALPASPAWRRLLLHSLWGLLFFTLLLPWLRLDQWLSRFEPITFHSGALQVARLEQVSPLYKSDARGMYVVLQHSWRLAEPLTADDRLLFILRRDDGGEAGRLSLDGSKRQRCGKQGCRVSFNSAMRVPDEAAGNEYSLWVKPEIKGAPVGLQFLRVLPSRDIALPHLLLVLGLIVALNALLLRALLPLFRRRLRSRVAASLLLGNLTFLLLYGVAFFRFGEFSLWSGFRAELYYLSWGAMVLGWGACALAGFHLYMGLTFTLLMGVGLLANFTKIAIYGVPLGGNDLGNLLGLLQILREEHPWAPWALAALLAVGCWRFALSRWLLRSAAATLAFFALCVFATQAGNRLLGPNVRYFQDSVTYHRDLIRSGPGLYLFNLVDDMVSRGSIFSYPLNKSALSPSREPTLAPVAPLWDQVIVLQYESLWLDWRGKICAKAPTLTLPAGVHEWRKTIHSPTTGGMTVLAEFEMNTGLPVGLLKQGIVPYYYLQQAVPGLAHTARANGYQTLFVHPYSEKFWGRDQAIPALGYQTRWFDTHFNAMEHKGLYVSDDALINQLVSTVQAEEPRFTYAVSMQGHGPFDAPRYQGAEREGACPGLSERERQTLNTYYTGVVDAMASLQRLLERLDASGSRYLVLAFGDHQPFLMSAGDGILGDKPSRAARYEIPMMVFTRQDDSLDAQQQFGDVRQLYQMGQALRRLLAGNLAQPITQPLLHPVLGEEAGFDPTPLLPQLRATFRPDVLP